MKALVVVIDTEEFKSDAGPPGFTIDHDCCVTVTPGGQAESLGVERGWGLFIYSHNASFNLK